MDLDEEGMFDDDMFDNDEGEAHQETPHSDNHLKSKRSLRSL
jgi:hypothetical protein